MDPATITMVISGAVAIIDAIRKLRQNAQQTKEWTPEQEAAFQSAIQQDQSQPHWQPSGRTKKKR